MQRDRVIYFWKVAEYFWGSNITSMTNRKVTEYLTQWKFGLLIIQKKYIQRNHNLQLSRHIDLHIWRQKHWISYDTYILGIFFRHSCQTYFLLRILFRLVYTVARQTGREDGPEEWVALWSLTWASSPVLPCLRSSCLKSPPPPPSSLPPPPLLSSCLLSSPPPLRHRLVFVLFFFLLLDVLPTFRSCNRCLPPVPPPSSNSFSSLLFLLSSPLHTYI